MHLCSLSTIIVLLDSANAYKKVPLDYERSRGKAISENIHVGSPKTSQQMTLEIGKKSPVYYNEKKKSVLDRLGDKETNSNINNKIKLSEVRKEEENFFHKLPNLKKKLETSRDSQSAITTKIDLKKRHIHFKQNAAAQANKEKNKPDSGVLSRIGVMSKIHIPNNELKNVSYDVNKPEVKSMVQVKPRIIPPEASHLNRNLLLKAVAEAEKSIAQASKSENKVCLYFCFWFPCSCKMFIG